MSNLCTRGKQKTRVLRTQVPSQQWGAGLPVPAKQGKRLISALQKRKKKDLISEVFIR